MRNFFVSAVLGCSLVAVVANADTLVFSGDVYDVYFTTPVAVGVVEDLVAFTIRIENTTGDAGYDLGAFDGAPTPFGYTGITGKLHQHYSPSVPVLTPTTDSAAYATAIDTHFLFTIAEMVVVTSPAEDTQVSPGTEPTDAPSPFDALAATSYGSYLTGTFATNVAVPILDLAYVVVEQGTPVKLDFFMSGTAGGEHIFYEVPEPTFAGLMLIAGVGLLRRRRRSRT